MQCKIVTESGEAEFISAMAGGWNPKLIIEQWSHGNSMTTSIGLAIAASHTGARHVCIVPDERSRFDYVNVIKTTVEMVVGLAEEVVPDFAGVDFLVVDGKCKGFGRVVRVARLSHEGAVLVCRNVSQRSIEGFRWTWVLGSMTRVVRSLVLPIGQGLDIAYVAYDGGDNSDGVKVGSRWIRHIDQESGEEHVYRG